MYILKNILPYEIIIPSTFHAYNYICSPSIPWPMSNSSDLLQYFVLFLGIMMFQWTKYEEIKKKNEFEQKVVISFGLFEIFKEYEIIIFLLEKVTTKDIGDKLDGRKGK